MKKLYSILFFCFTAILSIQAQDNLLSEANEAYKNNNYKEAIRLYEETAEKSGVSASLYYNTGNAYFKNKQYALAILNYERALMLEPNNDDARFNLELAKAYTVDKINAVEPFFLTQWVYAVKNAMTSNNWAVTGIVSFVLFITCLFVYFFTRQIVLKKIGFFGGLALLFVCIFANVFASDLKEKQLLKNEAIVFAPTVTIKSSPSESGTSLFILHEGAKVKVMSKVGEWSEILLEDGNRGWIPTDKIEII